MPLFMEYTNEMTYPVPEGIVGGFLTFFYNLVSYTIEIWSVIFTTTKLLLFIPGRNCVLPHVFHSQPGRDLDELRHSGILLLDHTAHMDD